MENFKKDIKLAKKMLNNASNNIKNIETALEASNLQELSNECIKYEKTCEKITNQSRLFPVSFGINNALNYVEDIILEENNVFIELSDDGFFYIKMPVLLNKKEGGNPTFIRSILFTALRDFFKKNNIEKFQEKCVIVFKHNYSKDRAYREMRDHDNIELNSVVDLVALFMMTDDSPLLLDHFYFSTNENDDDSTEIFLVPRSKFVNLLNGRWSFGG